MKLPFKLRIELNYCWRRITRRTAKPKITERNTRHFFTDSTFEDEMNVPMTLQQERAHIMRQMPQGAKVTLIRSTYWVEPDRTSPVE